MVDCAEQSMIGQSGYESLCGLADFGLTVTPEPGVWDFAALEQVFYLRLADVARLFWTGADGRFPEHIAIAEQAIAADVGVRMPAPLEIMANRDFIERVKLPVGVG